ncbi:unnamed protein product, partial [Symbiodinium sp. CCMP2456]
AVEVRHVHRGGASVCRVSSDLPRRCRGGFVERRAGTLQLSRAREEDLPLLAALDAADFISMPPWITPEIEAEEQHHDSGGKVEDFWSWLCSTLRCCILLHVKAEANVSLKLQLDDLVNISENPLHKLGESPPGKLFTDVLTGNKPPGLVEGHLEGVASTSEMQR